MHLHTKLPIYNLLRPAVWPATAQGPTSCKGRSITHLIAEEPVHSRGAQPRVKVKARVVLYKQTFGPLASPEASEV